MPGRISQLLDVPQTQRLLHLLHIRATDNGPVALISTYVRIGIAPGIESVDFSRHSLFETLENANGLSSSSGGQAFTAESTMGQVAHELKLDEGAPIPEVEQVTYLADGRPVEYSNPWISCSLLRTTSPFWCH